MIYPITIFYVKQELNTNRNYFSYESKTYQLLFRCYSARDLENARLWFPKYGRDVITQYDFSKGVNIRFMDGMGQDVHPSKIMDVTACFRPKPKTRKDNKSYEFRNGPVPGIRKGYWFRGYYRHVRTQQEIRENETFAVNDNDLEDYGIRVKGRKRSLPTLWDDIPVDREDRNWKKFRRTQWKG